MQNARIETGTALDDLDELFSSLPSCRRDFCLDINGVLSNQRGVTAIKENGVIYICSEDILGVIIAAGQQYPVEIECRNRNQWRSGMPGVRWLVRGVADWIYVLDHFEDRPAF